MKKNGLLIAIFFLISCVTQQAQVIPSLDENSGIILQKADFFDLKNFANDNLEDAIIAFERTCTAINKDPQILLKAKNIMCTESMSPKPLPRSTAVSDSIRRSV